MNKDDDLSHYNEKLAFELLDIQRLIAYAKSRRIWLGWERVLTGIGCLGVAGNAGLFGADFRLPRELLDQVVSEKRPGELLASGAFPAASKVLDAQLSYRAGLERSTIDLSFAEVSVLFDFASDLIGDEELHRFFDAVMRRKRSTPWALKASMSFDSKMSWQHAIPKILRPVPSGEGFYKYLDLSLDLANFVRSSEFPNASILFKECFAAWYREPFVVSGADLPFSFRNQKAGSRWQETDSPADEESGFTEVGEGLRSRQMRAALKLQYLAAQEAVETQVASSTGQRGNQNKRLWW